MNVNVMTDVGWSFDEEGGGGGCFDRRAGIGERCVGQRARAFERRTSAWFRRWWSREAGFSEVLFTSAYDEFVC